MTTLRSLRHTWSKYNRSSARGIEAYDRTQEWNCQACGLPQLPELDPYIFTVDDSTHFRICPVCQARVVRYNVYASINALIRACRLRFYERLFGN